MTTLQAFESAMLLEFVKSHCNNVRRQRFDDKRTLARTGYQALGAAEGFRNHGREGRTLQSAAKRNCTRCNSNSYA